MKTKGMRFYDFKKVFKCNTFCYFFGAMFLFGAGVFYGFRFAAARNYKEHDNDTARVESIKDKLRGIGDGLAGVKEAVSSGRSEVDNSKKSVDESLSIVGKIGSGVDRITRRNKDVNESIRRIERACKAIEQSIAEIKNTE